MNPPPRTRLALVACGALALLALLMLIWPSGRPTDPYADSARFKAAVGQALLANPEMVVEALQAMQARQGQMDQMQSRRAVMANRMALEQDGNSHVGGNPYGDITLVEFYDYRCPYCREANAMVKELIKSDPNLRFVYKEFPILGAESMIAARAAVATRSSSFYAQFHEALMLSLSPLTEESVLKIAGSIGMNVSALQLEMGSSDIDQIIAANHALAQQIGINGTPAFVIGDTLLPGVVELADMKQLIAKQRALGR